MTDFNYKKYSLEKLEEWVHDALDCDDVTPQDIYETITNAVDENIEYHKKYLTKNIEVLSLLKGHRTVDLDDVLKERAYYEGWDSQYTEEELNAMCDAAEDKEKCREYNLREAEYYDKRAYLDMNYNKMIAAGYTMTADGFWVPPQKEDKVVKWRLPVQQGSVDGVDDYYVEFPDDLLQAANLKAGDTVEWVDQGDGSYLLQKV